MFLNEIVKLPLFLYARNDKNDLYRAVLPRQVACRDFRSRRMFLSRLPVVLPWLGCAASSLSRSRGATRRFPWQFSTKDVLFYFYFETWVTNFATAFQKQAKSAQILPAASCRRKRFLQARTLVFFAAKKYETERERERFVILICNCVFAWQGKATLGDRLDVEQQ